MTESELEITTTERGFQTYGGTLVTSYGHDITVRESSAATGPHVWLFIGDSKHVDSHDPHLDLADAIRLRNRLNAFIDGVPERWANGARASWRRPRRRCTMNRKAIAFAVTFGALYAAHEFGDHWVQTNDQAIAKGKEGAQGRWACLGHVANLTTTKALALGVTARLTGVRLSYGRTVAALLADAATHYVIDRRAPLRKAAELIDPISGKTGFYDLGDDLVAPAGTGKYALDQSAHVALLWATALLIAGGAD